MSITDPAELPEFQVALDRSVKALRRLADYELEPAMQERLQDLGERKDLLGVEEHAELLALIGFSEQRTIEKLEASLALKQLQEMIPEVVEAA